jgi:hypothetical protein
MVRPRLSRPDVGGKAGAEAGEGKHQQMRQRSLASAASPSAVVSGCACGHRRARYTTSLPGREAAAERQKTGERPDERKAREQGKNARLEPGAQTKSGPKAARGFPCPSSAGRMNRGGGGQQAGTICSCTGRRLPGDAPEASTAYPDGRQSLPPMTRKKERGMVGRRMALHHRQDAQHPKPWNGPSIYRIIYINML